jgi:hypothetical protein
LHDHAAGFLAPGGQGGPRLARAGQCLLARDPQAFGDVVTGVALRSDRAAPRAGQTGFQVGGILGSRCGAMERVFTAQYLWL